MEKKRAKPRARKLAAPRRKCRCGAYLNYPDEKEVGKCSFCQASGVEPKDYPSGGHLSKDPEWEKEKKRKPRKAKRNTFD